MKVKVCGITGYEDAALALDNGVDALGFNFFPRSPRFINPLEARRIIDRLPPLTLCVGLFVNVPGQDEINEIARAAGVHVLQLHGDESPEYCRRLGNWPLIKAVRIGKDAMPENLDAFPVRAFLLDSKDDILFGGTGKPFDWTRALGIKKIRPVILAGGLRPENVSEAIRIVMPYAVDVCSGVESQPGKKDPEKVKALFENIRYLRG